MSFRKLFKKNDEQDKSSERKGVKKLLDKEGFYIIMFLCVCIVAVTAVWTAKSNIDRLAEDEIPQEEMDIGQSEIIDISENEIEDQSRDIIIIDHGTEPADTNVVNEEPKEENLTDKKPESSEGVKNRDGRVLVEENTIDTQVAINEEPIGEEKNEEEVVETSSEKAATKMVWPADGELGMGYAVETLIYSKTLEHYTTHHGIDIIAEKSTPVKAALAGKIIEVLTDSRLGITISIDHENGLVTRYSNLCTDAIVNVGDSVVEGQTISGIGTSSIFESAEEPHLHFEVLLNGKWVDPMDYLAEE